MEEARVGGPALRRRGRGLDERQRCRRMLTRAAPAHTGEASRKRHRSVRRSLRRIHAACGRVPHGGAAAAPCRDAMVALRGSQGEGVRG